MVHRGPHVLFILFADAAVFVSIPLLFFIAIIINSRSAESYNLIFHSLEVVTRYRDPPRPTTSSR